MRCKGGSWDGEVVAGHPHKTRKLVQFVRKPDGQQDQSKFETYIRETPGGDWMFAHPGTTSDADGPWHFPEAER